MKGASTLETVKPTRKQRFQETYFSSWDKYDTCDSINILRNNT